ncbi:hypothetical protein [Amycolatopsis sp. PS_44_ISF1]|uniref:hypothetical protein n=1 Tax=Amycolatopsis sp. PS_44_ISF1 TaxID=2974917 RepID=UPI0028DFA3B4|nr:hypothetical protein [Amycolatopsis sp. PS_44_ISF1]MDT8913762.1 hypothetical protein [Amycolatopsis sp. PS_44_ISF1]
MRQYGVAPGDPALGLPRIQGGYPLLDGPKLRSLALLPGHATVVAAGSPAREFREVDDVTLRRCAGVVEAWAVALRESGDVVPAVRSGAVRPDALVGLADRVRGRAEVPTRRPRLCKSGGMAWEDLVVAAERRETARGDRG